MRLRQLERDGAIVDINGDRASVRVVDTLDEETPYDLLLVTVLDHQTDAVMPSLKRSAAECIQFMFNTFHPERLAGSIGLQRCAFGMPFVQATLDSDGRLEATIGAAGQKTIMSEQRWVDAFNAAGLPAVLERAMAPWLRCHVPLCVAFEGVAVAGARRGGGASWEEAVLMARGIHASFAIIRGLGYDIYPTGKKLIAASPMPLLAATLWSLSRVTSFRELLATGKAECQTLVDVMVAAAPQATSAVDMARVRAMKPL